jgi:glycosyltransferase involved in cell wall biosynthesis
MRLLSVVIPVKDERANVRPLVQRLRDALTPACDWEAVFVDDGSTDGTHAELASVAVADSRVKVVRLRKNFGQSAALQAGFDHAAGDVVATMDGDLQNDPADLPKMIAKLDEGYDVILGERANRKDKFLLRKVPSWCANWLIRKTLHVPFRDFGCTLRVMRREVVEGMQLYGEMHRFITALAVQQGAVAAQVPVAHYPRTAGVSKYGLGRTVRVMLDLLTVKFLASYHTRPLHFFGGFGLLAMLFGLVSFVVTVGMKWGGGQWMTGNPLLLFSVLMEMLGVQLISVGLIGEGMTRANFERHGRRPYTVRQTVNVGTPADEPAAHQRAA